ncbi:BTB/POZ domain-containing protein NPY2 [Ananas comosus]|uniref:BTB/POZ domain-containing protein NPY2 n=1 Tax=Ananas comosus TaxID=4615 RepID=A0A199VHQ8_ANACO|nr:BTB/POZ domain-containing protein NPY2 [Ananas comosus]
MMGLLLQLLLLLLFSGSLEIVASELATDIIVHVGDVKFHLHKFPLLSKSYRLQRLVGDENGDEIHIPDIPGGPVAFEICAKFCYGVTVTLNAYNVVTARCAAEYLEMHETVEKGNLIYKIEVFLSTSIFRSWKDSIIVLQTTKPLLPFSENLKLVSHCIDSIASKASIDSSKVEWSYTYNRKKLPSENGFDSHWNGVKKQQSVPKDWWVEDLSELELDYFKQVIAAIKSKGRVSPQVIGEALKAYTYKRLPSLSKASMIHGDVKIQSLVENIIWLLPPGKGSVSCSFLLKLLRVASLSGSGEAGKRELIKRIGRQLEEASVPDLLIPTVEGENTIYDIDMVLNIVEEFVMQDNRSAKSCAEVTEELEGMKSLSIVSGASMVAVTKLVDGYLAEVAKDPNLPLSKFVDLAEMVSNESRAVHDGLYRAIDMFLKEHPSMNKSDRKKLCGLIDCKRLSPDACGHAVQNERLPSRMAVQVLYHEQARACATAAAAAANCRSDSGGITSYGSSRSAGTTNTTEDEWNGVEDLKSVDKSMKLGGSRGGGSERSSSSNEANKKHLSGKGSNEKPKVIATPKKILGKILSSKGQGGENSSSDTSGSPGSANHEEPKSTPARSIKYYVS